MWGIEHLIAHMERCHSLLLEEDMANIAYLESGKEDNDLSRFSKILINPRVIEEFRSKFPTLRHIRTGPNNKGFLYLKDGDPVAVISVENKDEGVYIQALEVAKDYRRMGLSKQLLEVAVGRLKARYLTVNKKNKVAIKIYKDFGFKVFKETDVMYFMVLNK